MEDLPTHIKIKILQYIPRRVHPVATIFKNALERHGNDMDRWLDLDYCDSCGEPCNDAYLCWICDYPELKYTKIYPAGTINRFD